MMTYADPELLFGVQARSHSAQMRRAGTTALVVAMAYYLGAKLGFALTLRPAPISTLWPPNSILLAGLLLTPTRWWWAVLLAALPAHLAIELQSGFPAPLVLGWFVSNCSEALIGAGLIRSLIKRPLRFDRSYDVWIFIFAAGFLATFLSSFLDAAFVAWDGSTPTSYWSLWRTRMLSNMLASLTVVSVILTWVTLRWTDLRTAPPSRYVEAGVLAAGLLAVSLFVFNGQQAGLNTAPVSLYAPLPFLLWATIRFGPRGTTACLMIVTFLAISGAVHGHGPFLTSSPADNAISIQAFLIVIAIPFLVLAALIGERAHAERVARESEERLNLAVGAAGIGAWEWRIPENRVSWTEKSRQILGLSDPLPDATFEQFLELVSVEDRSALTTAIRTAIREGSPYECEFRVIRPDSTTAWILGKGKALYDEAGQPKRLLGVNVDITERKLTEDLLWEEAALRESEAKFREMADAMPQIVWTATPDGEVDYYNRRWYALTGTDTSLGTDSWLLRVHPEDRQHALEAWHQAVATGGSCDVENRLQVGDTGEFRWHLVRAFPVRDRRGAVRRWYGSCTDIQDQKRVEQELRDVGLDLEARVTQRTAELSGAVVQLLNEIENRLTVERALRNSEERFGKAFHSSPDAIVIVRQSDYQLIEVNEKWEAMFGYSRAEAIAHSAEDFGIVVHGEPREANQTLTYRHALVDASGHLREFELDVRNKSGKTLRVVLVADTVDMAGEACYIIIIRDVTERKQAEAMVREQQRELAHLSRVAALGELSGALAHELNQPLAAILSNARAAQRMMAADQPNRAEVHEILEDIANDDRRAGDVIARLRSLLRKSDLQPRPVNLGDIVQEVISLLHSDLIQRRVSVTKQISPDLPRVLGDKVQLVQVLLNLVLNACDAMAEIAPPDRHLIIAASPTPEGVVQLSVTDRGVGISAERLEKIFDPFVTTKEAGLGLGLAICRSIVVAHGGRLWAVNNSDQGATILMELNPAGAGGAIATAFAR